MSGDEGASATVEELRTRPDPEEKVADKVVLTDIANGLLEIRKEIKSISERVAFLEHEDGEYFPPFATSGAPASEPVVTDVSAEYASVRATVQSVRLPPDLTLPTDTTKQGVKKQDQPLLNVIFRNARFCETVLKLLKSADKTDCEATLSSLFTVMCAQMKYLQDEHAALMVQSTFDPTVSRVFRSLQRNTSFTAEALENLRSAATIASAYRPQRSRPFNRGGYSDGGRGRDLFAQQSARGFPSFRGYARRNDFHSTGSPDLGNH